jgi:hypothetical protein
MNFEIRGLERRVSCELECFGLCAAAVNAGRWGRGLGPPISAALSSILSSKLEALSTMPPLTTHPTRLSLPRPSNRRLGTLPRAQSSSDGPSTSGRSSDTYEFTYQGSDGRMKATFEQAFKGTSPGAATASTSQAPWELGYQMSERDIIWNDDLKSRLLSRVAAQQLNITDEEMAARLEMLQTLLPDVRTKLPSMHPATVADLLANLDTLPEALMGIKAAFPGANASLLAVRAPELVLTMDPELLQIIAAQLQEMLPTLDVDRLVEENPSMLDVEELRAAMAEAARILPGLNIERAMGSDPQVILSFQRGSQLIPYDPPTPEEESEPDDDEYAAFYK